MAKFSGAISLDELAEFIEQTKRAFYRGIGCNDIVVETFAAGREKFMDKDRLFYFLGQTITGTPIERGDPAVKEFQALFDKFWKKDEEYRLRDAAEQIGINVFSYVYKEDEWDLRTHIYDLSFMKELLGTDVFSPEHEFAVITVYRDPYLNEFKRGDRFFNGDQIASQYKTLLLSSLARAEHRMGNWGRNPLL